MGEEALQRAIGEQVLEEDVGPVAGAGPLSLVGSWSIKPRKLLGKASYRAKSWMRTV